MSWSAEGLKEWEEGLEKLKPAWRAKLLELCQNYNPLSSLGSERSNLDSLRQYLDWQDLGWTKLLEADSGL